MLIGRSRTPRAKVLEKRVDVGHGVSLGGRREPGLLSDAAEVRQRGAVALDRLGGLALHLAGGEVRRNRVVDRGHRDLPSVYAVGTSLTHARQQRKSKVYSVPCTTGLGDHREPGTAATGRQRRVPPCDRRSATTRAVGPSATPTNGRHAVELTTARIRKDRCRARGLRCRGRESNPHEPKLTAF